MSTTSRSTSSTSRSSSSSMARSGKPSRVGSSAPKLKNHAQKPPPKVTRPGDAFEPPHRGPINRLNPITDPKPIGVGVRPAVDPFRPLTPGTSSVGTGRPAVDPFRPFAPGTSSVGTGRPAVDPFRPLAPGTTSVGTGRPAVDPFDLSKVL